MTNEEKLQLFEHQCRHSTYTLFAHETSIELHDAFDRLGFYLFRSEYRQLLKEKGISSVSEANSPELLKELAEKVLSRVPEFQRDNDKWTSDMQESFIHNLLKGFKAPDIILYSLDGSNSNCFILDGLQRLTAVMRFLVLSDMKFPIGNGEFIESKLVTDAGFSFFGMRSSALRIKVFHFKNELAAVDHYIEINENITHSTDDIQRAKEYRAKLIESANAQ